MTRLAASFLLLSDVSNNRNALRTALCYKTVCFFVGLCGCILARLYLAYVRFFFRPQASRHNGGHGDKGLLRR